MNISIVIPVFNAALYVERAVESALAQPETAEVVLVEDGATDDSLAVCQKLAEAHAKVRLLRHPDGKNRGAGESRSLGVRGAAYDWIAFLDADDFFLPGRFKESCRVLDADHTLDGVCEAVGVHYDTPLGRVRAEATGRHLTITFAHPVMPDAMFAAHAPIGDVGYFHLNGLTVRKQSVIRAGAFQEALRLHQDTEFAVRLTAIARLTTGVIDRPVALRGLHDNNRISQQRSVMERYRLRVKMWKYLYPWCQRNLDPRRFVLADAALAREIGSLRTWTDCRILGRVQWLRQVVVIAARAPILLRSRALLRRLFSAARA